MDFSTRLKSLREKKGLSQERLAEQLKIPRSTIAHYENSEDRLPRRARLKEIADYFNVNIDYLLGESDDPSPRSDRKSEEIYDDPDFQVAMRSAQGFSKENKQKVLEYIEMIEEIEKGRKPGDRQPRRKKFR